MENTNISIRQAEQAGNAGDKGVVSQIWGCCRRPAQSGTSRTNTLPMVCAVKSMGSPHPRPKLQLHPLCHAHPSFWGFRLCHSTSPSLQETEKMLFLHLLLAVPRSWSAWSAVFTSTAPSGAGCSPFSQCADSSLLETSAVESSNLSAIPDFWFFYSALRGDSVQSGQSSTAGRGSQVPSPLSRRHLAGSIVETASPCFTWDSSRIFKSAFVKKHILMHTLPLKVGRACKMAGLAKAMTWNSVVDLCSRLVLSHDFSNGLRSVLASQLLPQGLDPLFCASNYCKQWVLWFYIPEKMKDSPSAQCLILWGSSYCVW